MSTPITCISKTEKITSKSPIIAAEEWDEEPSEELKKAIENARENRKKGNHSPTFNTGEEAVAWLEKHGL